MPTFFSNYRYVWTMFSHLIRYFYQTHHKPNLQHPHHPLHPKEHRQKANSYLSQAQNYYSEAWQNKSSTTKFLLSQTSSYLGGLKQELPEYMKGNDVKRWT